MRFTLYGLYEYDDEKLFENIILPADINKDYVVNEILKRSGDLFTYYQVPMYFKRNVEVWFARNYDNFYKMIQALLSEYNPIENYDRTEESTHTPRETVTTAKSGQDVRTITTQLGSINTNNRSAFDSTGFSPNEQNVTSGGDTSTDTNSLGSSETITNGGDHKFKSHIHGNIGVTTNSQMITQELELRKYDIYAEIARRFEREFLINIY